MDWRLIVIIVVAILLIPAGSPVQLSYVSSDSMEPALQEGDGYVLVPAGQVQQGDVVTYRSPRSDEHVTHRVVDVTDDGLVTKGDANDVTDQSTGEPHVQRSAVVGEVLTVAGTVLAIPNLGAATAYVNRHLLELVGVATAALLLRELRREPDTSNQRPIRVGEIVVPLLVGVGVLAVVMVFVAASSHSLTYVAVNGDTDHAQRLTVGEPATKPVLLEGDAPPFSHRIVSADGMQIEKVEADGEKIRLSVSVPPPPKTGPYTKRVRVHHYPATLPQPMLRQLHAVHPFVAAVFSVGSVLGPLSGLAMLLVDSRQPIRTPRSRRLREVIDR